MDKKVIKFDDTESEEYKFYLQKSPIVINDIDINETVVSNKFPFGKQDFKYFIVYKDNKEIRPLCIFFPEIIYKRYSDKTKCTYFMIKDEKKIDKNVTILEKVSKIIKKFLNSEIIYNKKYPKTGKRFIAKERFQCFCILLLLFYSVYTKDGNYHLKVFLEKIVHNFCRKCKFWFLGFWKFFLKKRVFQAWGQEVPFPKI